MAGSAVVGTLRAILTLDTADFESASKQVSESAKAWTRDFKSIGQQATALGSQLTKTVTLPLVGLGLGVSKLSIDFESAFAGVKKTVDATAPEFAALSQGFRDLSKEMPVSVTELLKVGEAAGQLGIKKENIIAFTATMAKLGATTNLTADQAATSMARFTNIMGTPQAEIDKLGASLVALGNDGASTEAEIVDMALRIAGAGKTIGLTEGDVLGLANALSSVGIEAEMGGSAISKVMINIASSVEHGGDELKKFADVAGMSGKAFADLFKRDAGEAMQAFLGGLGRVQERGHTLLGTLDELGIKEVRLRDTMLRVANAGDLVGDSMRLGNEAFREGTALNVEFAKRAETLESKLTVLWNRIKDVGITIGDAMKPAIDLAISAAGRLIPVIETLGRWFAALPEPVKLAAIGVGALAAAAGPAIFIFGQLALSAAAIAQAFTTKGIAMKVLKPIVDTMMTTFRGLFGVVGEGSGLVRILAGAFELLSGPVGWFLGAAAAVLTATGTWDELWRSLKAVGTILANVVVGAFGMFVDVGRAFLSWVGDVGGAIGRLLHLNEVLGAIGHVLGVAKEAFASFMGFVADTLEGLALATGRFIETLPKVTSPFEEWTKNGLVPAGDAAKYLAMSTDELNKMLAPNAVHVKVAALSAEELKKQQEAAKKEAAELAKALDALNDAAHQLGVITERDVNDEMNKLRVALGAAMAGGVSLKNALPGLIAKLDELAKKAKASGLSVDELVDTSKALKAELDRLSGGKPVLPASLFISGKEGLAALARGTQTVTAEMLKTRTQASLLSDAYRLLGIKSRDELLATAEAARQAYRDIFDSGSATADQLIEARRRVTEAERAAGLETVSIWRDTIMPAISGFMEGVSVSVSSGLVNMIGHWSHHASILREIWQGIKNSFLNILDQMLAQFINGFLQGMLNAIGAAKLGNALANSLLSGLGLGGGGGGNLIGAAAGLIGGGGGAAGVLTPSVVGGAIAANAPAGTLIGTGAGAGGGIGVGGALVTVGSWALPAIAPLIIGQLINPGPLYTPYLSPDQVREAYEQYFGAGFESLLPDDLMHVMPGDVPWWQGHPEGSGAEPDRETIMNMAAGGIVMPQVGGTIARLAEAGVPEAVIPLDHAFSGGGAPMRPLILQLDGRTLGRVMFNPLAREAARLHAGVS